MTQRRQRATLAEVRTAWALLAVAVLGGGCGATTPADPPRGRAASAGLRPAVTSVAASSTAGPPRLDADGNPMLGGAGPLEVVQVVSGESLDLRQDDRVVRWRLGQVDAPEGDECHAAASKAWLEEYVRPVSHPYLAFRPTGVPAEAGSAVELVVADVARVVGDRGSVNVAAVRAGAARWAGLPSGTASADDAERAMAEDLSARLSAAEADARAGRRGLWGACPDAPAASPAPGDGGLPGSEAHGS